MPSAKNNKRVGHGYKTRPCPATHSPESRGTATPTVRLGFPSAKNQKGHCPKGSKSVWLPLNCPNPKTPNTNTTNQISYPNSTTIGLSESLARLLSCPTHNNLMNSKALKNHKTATTNKTCPSSPKPQTLKQIEKEQELQINTLPNIYRLSLSKPNWNSNSVSSNTSQEWTRSSGATVSVYKSWKTSRKT